MPHRNIALDIGSHSIKVLIAESTFGSQKFRVKYYTETALGPLERAIEEAERDTGDSSGESSPAAATKPKVQEHETLSKAALQAIETLKDRGLLEGDSVVVNYRMNHCLQTEIRLPQTLSRDKVEEILAVQIEEHFPLEYSELLTDFDLSPDIDEEGLRKVTVISTPLETLREFLEALDGLEIDPTVVEVGPARLLGAYRAIVATPASPVALIDIGHEGSDVCVVEDDDIILMRRLAVGGRDFTEALAQAFDLPFEKAEEGKHSEGYVELGQVGGDRKSESTNVGTVCRKVASILADELTRTLHSHAVKGGKPVSRLVFCGGGSLLRGLVRYLSMALGIPADHLTVDEVQPFRADGGPKAVGAIGLIARALGRRPASRFNLRQGPLSYRGGFEFFQNRIPWLLVLAGLFIAAVVFSTLTKRGELLARRDAYQETLVALSEPVFGEVISNPREVTARLQTARNGPVVLPEYSAYELFLDISAALVDLRELGVPLSIERMTIDIQRDVISLQGSTDSAISVDEIMTELDGLECVGNVTQERTTQNRATGDYEFELRAVNTCS